MATGIENLKIYNLARNLEFKVHNLTKSFPKDERFRSVDQLNRSASSVTNNIAEAYYKKSAKEKIRILRNIAITEAEETRTNLIRCAEKGFFDVMLGENISNQYIELRKTTFGYIKFLQKYIDKSAELINSSTD